MTRSRNRNTSTNSSISSLSELNNSENDSIPYSPLNDENIFRIESNYSPSDTNTEDTITTNIFQEIIDDIIEDTNTTLNLNS